VFNILQVWGKIYPEKPLWKMHSRPLIPVIDEEEDPFIKDLMMLEK